MSVRLDGCRDRPLGSYLQGLGVWRALDRSGVVGVRASWADGRLVLDGAGDLEDIVNHLAENYSPLPIVSPWNAGSGFAGNGKSKSAEVLLERIESDDDDRLAEVRDAVRVSRAVVDEGQRRGWGGANELWDKKRKADVIQLCRNRLPDAAVEWIDATVVLSEDVSFSRLLGTGGNFGRQDLSSTYLDAALAVTSDPAVEQLRSALSGDETVSYSRGTVGQFDPGRAGGVQSSPAEKSDSNGFVNTWSTLLTIEGAMFFTSSLGRRQGSDTARASVPFQVNGATSAFDGAALDESVSGEVWTPTWSSPASIDEVRQLMRDGRAEWSGGPARTGLDFALAVRSLGTDRGIDKFTRHVIVNRHGQSPLAVAVDAIQVPTSDRTSGIEPITIWLDRLRRVGNLPRSIAMSVESVEDAVLGVSKAREGSFEQRTELIRRLGRLHRLVERSGSVRASTQPLLVSKPHQWIDLDGDSTIRLAVALASARDTKASRTDAAAKANGRSLGQLSSVSILRAGLGHVVLGAGGLRWAERPSPIDSSASLDVVLAAVHARRAAASRSSNDPSESHDNAEPMTAVKGIVSSPSEGRWALVADLAALVHGEVDLVDLRELLDGFLLFDWRTDDVERWTDPPAGDPLPAALALLLPFGSRRPLPVAIDRETGRLKPTVLRSAPEWPSLLRAGRLDRVVEDAVRRLRAASVQGVPPASSFVLGGIDAHLLSAALFCNVSPSTHIRAVRQIADVPAENSKNDQGDS